MRLHTWQTKRTALPALTLKMRAVLSLLPLASRDPSAFHATLCTTSLWPLKATPFLSRTSLEKCALAWGCAQKGQKTTASIGIEVGAQRTPCVHG